MVELLLITITKCVPSNALFLPPSPSHTRTREILFSFIPCKFFLFAQNSVPFSCLSVPSERSPSNLGFSTDTGHSWPGVAGMPGSPASTGARTAAWAWPSFRPPHLPAPILPSPPSRGLELSFTNRQRGGLPGLPMAKTEDCPVSCGICQQELPERRQWSSLYGCTTGG